MPRRLVAIVALSLGTALTVIDGNIVTVALPTIARDMHVDGAASVLVVTIYQLTLVMTLLPFSALGDRIGLKRLYQYGQILFTIATFLCFFAKSLPFLLAIRVMQALGAAAALSMMSALIRNVYPSKHLGRGMAVNSTVVAVGAAIAPTAGGLILAVAPWPWLFAGAVPFAILSLFLGWRSLPDIPGHAGRYNLAGAMLNMATFGLLIGGAESAIHGDSPVVSAAIIVAGAIFAVWFVRHERKEERPILPIDLLSNPILALSSSGALIVFSGSMLLMVSLPFRLQHLYGFAPSVVGAVITPYPLAMMIMSPIGGILSDRIHPGLLGGIGMAIGTCALALIAFPPAHPVYFDFAWRMALCGSGFALYMAPNARLIVGSAPRNRAAAVGGLISTTRLTGQTVGATVMAMLLALGFGNTSIPVFVSMACAMVGGLFSVARLKAPASPPAKAPAAAMPDV